MPKVVVTVLNSNEAIAFAACVVITIIVLVMAWLCMFAGRMKVGDESAPGLSSDLGVAEPIPGAERDEDGEPAEKYHMPASRHLTQSERDELIRLNVEQYSKSRKP